MVELCLMASHGYPPGLGVVFHPEHVSSRGSEASFMFNQLSFVGFMGYFGNSIRFMFTW